MCRLRYGDRAIVVEYDGDEHYRNTLKIKADSEKDAIAQKQGFKVVRVPYWVQLDTVMLKKWSGLDAVIEQDFPHGFISTKIFPASFCTMGRRPVRAGAGVVARDGEGSRGQVPAGPGRGARG